MKKLLIFAVAAVSMVQMYGQGTINFSSNAGQEITNSVTGARIPTASGFVIGMYYGIAGTASDAGVTLIATTIVQPVAGRFSGGTVTTPATTAPGAACVIQIRAWSGSFATYDLAVAAGGNNVVGKSVLFNVTTGNPNPPATTAGTLAGMNGFTLTPVVPEPSSIALGLLGLGAVALFRRRK